MLTFAHRGSNDWGGVSKEAKSAHVIIEQRTGKKPLVVEILIKCLFPYDFLRDLSICQGYFSPWRYKRILLNVKVVFIVFLDFQIAMLVTLLLRVETQNIPRMFTLTISVKKWEFRWRNLKPHCNNFSFKLSFSLPVSTHTKNAFRDLFWAKNHWNRHETLMDILLY